MNKKGKGIGFRKLYSLGEDVIARVDLGGGAGASAGRARHRYRVAGRLEADWRWPDLRWRMPES